MPANPEEPLILLFGCSELGRPLRARKMACSSVRSLRQLLQPKEGLEARAILMGEPATKELDLAEVVAALRRTWPLVDVILWSQQATARQVRDALRAGARDVLLTRSPEIAARTVAEIVESQQLLPRAARIGTDKNEGSTFQGMVSRSRRMWDLFDTASRVATTEATVLILGETGTGKELLARAIHRLSGRDGRFVAINCAAVPEGVIDSELFGHVEGAFTGASSDKEGLFRHADHGTILLDEIGNVPLTVQYRLLRTLQEGSLRPVGGHSEISVDVRVIAATSTKLEDDVQRGRFREDLFYRLDVIRLDIPPLRERPEDIIYLFGQFARQCAEQYEVSRPDVSDDFLDALVDYEWPGNVRQLENFTERLVLTHPSRRVTATHFRRLLPFKKKRSRRSREPVILRVDDAAPDRLAVDTTKPLAEAVGEQMKVLERRYLEACLDESNGRIGATAARAGISRRTLLRKLKQYGIDKADFRRSADQATR